MFNRLENNWPNKKFAFIDGFLTAYTLLWAYRGLVKRVRRHSS